MARTYYALELLGQQKRLHDDLFNAWNVNNIDLSDEAKITEFVGQRGIDRKKFSDAYNSFAMQSKVTRSKQLAQIYGIRGTPSLTVDGKYLISGLGPEESIKVLNALIDKARKEPRASISAAQRVVISGASSGLGLALARHYLEQGAMVAVLARRADCLQDLSKQFPQQVYCYPLMCVTRLLCKRRRRASSRTQVCRIS